MTKKRRPRETKKVQMRLAQDGVDRSFEDLLGSSMPLLKARARKILSNWPLVGHQWEPDDLLGEVCVRLIALDNLNCKTEEDLLKLAQTYMKNIVRDKKSWMAAQKRSKYKEVSLVHVHTDC